MSKLYAMRLLQDWKDKKCGEIINLPAAEAAELIESVAERVNPEEKTKTDVLASVIEANGKLYEQVHHAETGMSYFVYLNDEKPHYSTYVLDGGQRYLPMKDDAISEGAVMLPNKAADFGDLNTLVGELKAHIHKYCDISEDFELFAVYYIILTWVSDRVNTVPYLRVLGDSGTGKSRFLTVVGSLCYKPSIVSGAITPAPIYRMLKRWGGTIVLDEADFSDSSEKHEVVKILNCGFERGRPVIRCVADNPEELSFLPTFGPKLIATRYAFDDKALESRCLTERTRETTRTDIPALLPFAFYEHESDLRNKLLMFRLKCWDKIDASAASGLNLGEIEPRLRQATASFAVLFAGLPELTERFKQFLQKYNEELVEERAQTLEGLIIQIIKKLRENGSKDISSSDLETELRSESGLDKITAKKIGKHLKSLGITTKPCRSGRTVKRFIVWDENLMKNLYKRYIPKGGYDTNETNETNETVVSCVSTVSNTEEAQPPSP